VLKSWLCRRKGFTLIELLVVIAIIGILAAMLFPVFARARESARKTQCLANVKNIAMAIQIYLTDYDRFPPDETNAEIIQWFKDTTAAAHSCGGQGFRASWANPYIRWPVILDEYTKSREVWSCPSAKWNPNSVWIVPGYAEGWFKYLQDTLGSGWTCYGYSDGGAPCSYAFPPGWGGDVTDAIKQQTGNISPADHPTMFAATIGAASVKLTGTSTAAIDDASKTVVCGDGTQFGMVIQGANSLLYEECGTCGKADWVNCSWTANNACNTLDVNLADKWATDPGYRATFTRHMGGSNLGFADGHAKWFMADAVVAAAPRCSTDCTCTALYTDPSGQPYLGGLCP
jgi:prepilin-type N-terminal cleavage/methylation domain-containing protein/prepilin-type processing-associated H-X9-DG protein